MSTPVIRKLLFTFTFPLRPVDSGHTSRTKLLSLAKRQLSDYDVIETIDHLFRCPTCYENYRLLKKHLQHPGNSQLIKLIT